MTFVRNLLVKAAVVAYIVGLLLPASVWRAIGSRVFTPPVLGGIGLAIMGGVLVILVRSVVRSDTRL